MSEDTHFEPKLALFGGEKTGFELYEKLFEQFTLITNPFSCIFEFGFDQRELAE
jgi:methylase of polypeptide subunit release factors